MGMVRCQSKQFMTYTNATNRQECPINKYHLIALHPTLPPSKSALCIICILLLQRNLISTAPGTASLPPSLCPSNIILAGSILRSSGCLGSPIVSRHTLFGYAQGSPRRWMGRERGHYPAGEHRAPVESCSNYSTQTVLPGTGMHIHVNSS